jgi:hypothetical protein
MGPKNDIDSDELRRSEQTPGVRELRRTLRSLPQRRLSADLGMRLRVLASKESSRQQSRASWGQLWNTWMSDFRLWANNLMRPLAIPTAGGFVSALMLFGVLAPALAMRGAVVTTEDVPTVLYTEASVRSFMPLGFHDEDITIEVTIDGDGRVIDYSLPSGHPKNHALHRSIENYLLFTQFTPVRNFGQPVNAKVRISFQSSRIEVKG